MNQTLNISLGGHLLEMDPDAHQRLKDYLDDIEQRLKHYPEKRELVHDIEVAMAEKLKGLLNNKVTPLVTIHEIEQLISVMGSAADIAGDQSGSSDSHNTTTPSTGEVKKRLFRDPDHKMVAGVCAGLAAYFGVDVAIVRIIFVILFIIHGSGLLIYIALWIVLSEANTTNEKMQMHGEPITLANIQETLKQEKEKLKKNSTLMNTIGSIMAFLVKGIAIIVAAAFIIPLVGVALGLLAVLIFGLSFTIANVSIDGAHLPMVLTLGIPLIISLGLLSYITITATVSLIKNKNVFPRITPLLIVILVIAGIWSIASVRSDIHPRIQINENHWFEQDSMPQELVPRSTDMPLTPFPMSN